MASSPPRIERLSGEHTLLYLVGEITVAFLHAYKSTCVAACAGGGLTVDLSGCSHMDSSGLGLLVTMNRKQKDLGGSLTLKATPAPIQALLDKTQLTSHFQFS